MVCHPKNAHEAAPIPLAGLLLVRTTMERRTENAFGRIFVMQKVQGKGGAVRHPVPVG